MRTIGQQKLDSKAMKIILPASNRFFALAAWIAFIGLSSCFKDFAENYGEEEIIIENAAIGVQEADDALEVAYYAEAIQKVHGGSNIVTNCGVISNDPVNKILTINFSDSTCLGLFSRPRRGKILVTYTTQLTDSLSDKTISFVNYFVNYKKVEGAVTLHDISFTADRIQVATRTLVDLRVENANGTAITFNGSHKRNWISGMADSIITNNVYRFEGSISGVSSSGRTFKQDIISPVIANFYCASTGYFARSSGVIELSELKGYPNRKRTVDYGSGQCDKAISVETFRRTYGVGAN